MPPERIVAQEIEVAPVEKGILARVLIMPGTISLDPGRVARVPGRVEGTVIEMRKRFERTDEYDSSVAPLPVVFSTGDHHRLAFLDHVEV
jgi:cobalt-zinc-cadmium efflux system membrane fusion protein